jgi:hypothetical protein
MRLARRLRLPSRKVSRYWRKRRVLPPQRPEVPSGPVSGRVRPPVYPRLFRIFRLEPRAGVEPAFQSYQDCGLPLSDVGLVPARGVAPLFLPRHGSGLQLTYAGLSSLQGGPLRSSLLLSARCCVLSAVVGVTDRSRTG